MSIMDNRPSRDKTYIEIAHVISKRGTCGRAKVGCVITLKNRPISTGYNGPLHSGIPCESRCDITKSCGNAVHAEMNAIANAAKNGISLDGATLYCTHAPCSTCASMIVQAGIQRVVYSETYRLADGLEILQRQGIDVEVLKYTKE